MDKLCRVCIELPTKCISIDSRIGPMSGPSFLEFIDRCAGINTRGKPLPKFICLNCAERVKTIYAFVKKVLKSMMIFKEALNDSSPSGECNNEARDGNYTCKRSKIDFEDREEFRTLYRKHDLDKSTYECEQCWQTFTDIKKFKAHAVRHVETKYKCTECGRDYKTGSNLRRHMTVHTGEKPHECKVCCKRFRLRANLNKHFKVHIDEHTGQIVMSRKFECEICHKMYSTPRSLYGHMKLHTSINKCDLCNMEFALRDALLRHLRDVHKDELPTYSCTQCDKKYKNKTGLYTHVKFEHNGAFPKRFNCNSCDKRFKTISNLRKHILKSHTGAKPKCKTCGMMFDTELKYSQHSETCKYTYRPTTSTINTENKIVVILN